MTANYYVMCWGQLVHFEYEVLQPGSHWPSVVVEHFECGQ